MPKLSQIRKPLPDAKELKIAFDVQTEGDNGSRIDTYYVNVKYKPARYTPQMEQLLSDLRERRMFVVYASTVVFNTVTEWDLTDDETDEPIPLTQEGIGTVDGGILDTIAAAVLNDMAPPKANSTRSGSLSRAAR